jgi:LPXTG-motif cell wall-anchored protein
MSTQEPQVPQTGDSRRAAVVALILVLMLVLGGLLLEHILSDSARLQDCVMQGRTNCDPIDSNSTSR